ncbi:diguanylate cyclase/phosphodiesterase [Dyella jiangningensis]|uniref:GGDEF domain-containing protein n=1 Tax=Dyella sp. AtDHG13 TaxID=1938897 RepID=UPI0008859F4B|nr:GGDEF domain-containing protein [Dyella sp. AtDHG13]PXV58273.1 diguanylate cyclase/phosphodiesterase [Dyella sp. AtDHG13]SDK09329.1 diguanylate cyclase/phosphodiesterase [Dyella jiangningensis]
MSVSLAYTHKPHAMLERALLAGSLRPVFQPVVRVDTLEVVAHEGLSRCAFMPGNISILDLLDMARMEDRLAELELHAARTLCRAFEAQTAPGRLLVNLSAHAILHDSLRPDDVLEAVSSCGLDPARVTIEVTERDVVESPARLAHALGYLRAHGMRIALDDFGNGHSNFEMWNEIHPDVVKIDRYLIHGLSRSAGRLAIVRSLCQVAESLGTDLVGEGVEDPADLRVLRDLGIPYAQGFLLGRPAEHAVHEVSAEARQVLRTAAVPVLPRPRGPVTQRPTQVSHLLMEAPSVHPRQTNDEVMALFVEHPELHAVAVVKDGQPIGLINRRLVNERMAQPFARELLARKSCTALMNSAPLVCDENRSLESLADVLRGEDQRYLADGFIVTRKGHYLGLGTGEALVRRVSELRIEAARHANPLTFLPGNIPTTEHLERLIDGGDAFTVVHVDLTDFKPFNDHYGYSRGDEMIRLLSSLLSEHVDPSLDFVGHIGGDDFVVLFQSTDREARCQRIIDAFNARSPQLFDTEDLAHGGLRGKDRRGEPQFFPCTTVVMGAVELSPPLPQRAQSIAMLAARAKRQAKRAHVSLHVFPKLSAAT